ncbi:MAG: DUF2380 domain-containing protein [Methylocystis sp.]
MQRSASFNLEAVKAEIEERIKATKGRLMARRAGAKLMLFGIHKVSTLGKWARVELIDVVEDRLLEERRLSFRGDNDEAWRRAADYVAQRLIMQPAGQERR